MLLRHPREIEDGIPVENAFEVVEERTGEQLGACRLYEEKNAVLFPARPYQVRLAIAGEGAREALLGAAIARSRALCAASGVPSRIYTACAPDDDAFFEDLSAYGFKDSDGLVRMRKGTSMIYTEKQPIGCAVVRDNLSDPIEREYFINRYNQLYQCDGGEAWVSAHCELPGFTRLLTVSPTGLAGEIVIWFCGYVGVVGYLQTSKRWRRMGVASFMLALADEVFSRESIRFAEADVRARIPGALKTMEHSGYRQEKLLTRYPGIDVG